jgi:hypothetical protein
MRPEVIPGLNLYYQYLWGKKKLEAKQALTNIDLK